MTAPIAPQPKVKMDENNELEQSFRSQKANIITITNLAPGYDPKNLGVQATKCKGRLEQVNSQPLRDASKPADPALKDYETRAIETLRPSFKHFSKAPSAAGARTIIERSMNPEPLPKKDPATILDNDTFYLLGP